MHLEMKFVDTTTCKSATILLVDVWSCDATGVYSGVSASGEVAWIPPFFEAASKPTQMVVLLTSTPSFLDTTANEKRMSM